MRIFVSGRDGQVAQSLALHHGGHPGLEIVCAGRPSFDLLDPSAAEAFAVAISPDAIVNAAAYTAVDKAESEPELAMRINRDGAAAMARAAAKLGVPLVHISTDYVFSGDKTCAYVETDTTGPLGVYGQTKLAGELAVAELVPHHAILRTSWVYSPYGSNFVKTMLRLGVERSELNVVADQLGSPTSARDLAEAVVKITQGLKNQSQNSGIYNVAGSGSTSWAGFAEQIFALLAMSGKGVPSVRHITTSEYPTAARRPLNSVLNCQKLKDVFGVEMPEWQESLRQCVTDLMRI